jgi:DNA-binding Lrp family transcriptional regulator
MDILSNLFGSQSRVKIMRLFLFNPQMPFSVQEIAEKTKTRLPATRKEVRFLEKAKLIRKRSFKIKRKKVAGWSLNSDFPYLTHLQNLLLDLSSLQQENILKKLNKVGRLKEVVLAGVFIQDWDSRADILVVADRIKRRVLENLIKHLEAEIGKELKYIALETNEFQYRMSMGDKLLRDILDYPHKVALDKFGLLS